MNKNAANGTRIDVSPGFFTAFFLPERVDPRNFISASVDCSVNDEPERNLPATKGDSLRKGCRRLVSPMFVAFTIVGMTAPQSAAGVPVSAALCRDYLALSDAEAMRIGFPQFEGAAHALLAASPRTETALALMKHRLQVVRGRAILDCLAHDREPWAHKSLETAAPFALAYRIPHE